jgi:hypothetical protein
MPKASSETQLRQLVRRLAKGSPRFDMPKSLIEPPGPFSAPEVLEDFLKQARTWDQTDGAVQYAIWQTERALKRQKKRRKRVG